MGDQGSGVDPRENSDNSEVKVLGFQLSWHVAIFTPGDPKIDRNGGNIIYWYHRYHRYQLQHPSVWGIQIAKLM